jgi:hypothetical protein
MYRTIMTKVYHNEIEDFKISMGVLCSKKTEDTENTRL